MVTYTANLSNGNKWVGTNEDGSWHQLKEFIESSNGVSITSISLGNNHGHSDIDSNADGYFLCNKIITPLYSQDQLELIGLGYWKKTDNVARIKWHNTNTLECVDVEARLLKDCGFSFIKNPL